MKDQPQTVDEAHTKLENVLTEIDGAIDRAYGNYADLLNAMQRLSAGDMEVKEANAVSSKGAKVNKYRNKVLTMMKRSTKALKSGDLSALQDLTRQAEALRDELTT